jgi:hypothetical protein
MFPDLDYLPSGNDNNRPAATPRRFQKAYVKSLTTNVDIPDTFPQMGAQQHRKKRSLRSNTSGDNAK